MNTSALLAPWGVNDINELLRPQPLRLEMGLTRSTEGLLTVAIRTDLHGCKGRMLDWWFTFFETTQHIRWWHPHDHVEHRGWDHHWKRGERYVGASIAAVEWLAELPPVAARLKFHGAEEVFDPQPLQEARETQALSAAICARIDFGDEVALDEQGAPLDGEMLHLVRDTPYGCVLRSRFLLGKACANPLDEVPDEIGFNLMRHCYSEFSYLAQFLPSLYYAENGREPAPRLW
ncbi:TPA: hydrolase [Aeromonas dhakensis]|nr:hydrolase [Aeromonas dhakensis]